MYSFEASGGEGVAEAAQEIMVKGEKRGGTCRVSRGCQIPDKFARLKRLPSMLGTVVPAVWSVFAHLHQRMLRRQLEPVVGRGGIGAEDHELHLWPGLLQHLHLEPLDESTAVRFANLASVCAVLVAAARGPPPTVLLLALLACIAGPPLVLILGAGLLAALRFAAARPVASCLFIIWPLSVLRVTVPRWACGRLWSTPPRQQSSQEAGLLLELLARLSELSDRVNANATQLERLLPLTTSRSNSRRPSDCFEYSGPHRSATGDSFSIYDEVPAVMFDALRSGSVPQTKAS